MAFVILVVPLDLLMILEDLARKVQFNMRVVHLILIIHNNLDKDSEACISTSSTFKFHQTSWST